MKPTWIAFDGTLFDHQPLPVERRDVLVVVDERPGACGKLPPTVAIGYLRYAAGCKDSPYFVVPGVGGPVRFWSDCLGSDFSSPLKNKAVRPAAPSGAVDKSAEQAKECNDSGVSCAG